MGGSDRHGLVEDGSSSNCDAIRALSPFTSTPLPATTASYSAATPHLHHHSNVSSEGGAIVAATPPTCMSRVNTHLSKCDDVLNTDGCDDHIAEQLAAGLLIDDADDTELEDNDRKLDKHRREEEKVSIEQEVKEGFSAGDETIMPKVGCSLSHFQLGFQ